MTRPIVFLPGMARLPSDLDDWRDLGQPMALPGQGLPVLPRMDFESLLADLKSRVPADALVIGESFGGLLALGLDQPVIAIDPPLTTAKLWSVQLNLRNIARQIRRPAFDDLLASVFGYMPDGSVEERIYYSLLKRAAPTHIVTGDRPLFPVGLPDPQPCLIDGVDRYMIAQSDVVLHELPGPHGLMTHNPAEVRRIIVEVVQTLG